MADKEERSVEEIFKDALQTNYYHKMVEEEEEKKVEDIFKDAFKPAAASKKEEEKPASELFRDIFSVKSPSEVKPQDVSQEEKHEMEKEVGEWLKEREEPAPDASPAPEAGSEKPASNMFKDIFSPADTLNASEIPRAPEPGSEKPASDMFKDIFSPADNAKKANTGTPEPEAEKPKEEAVKDVGKTAKLDEQTVQKIIKSNVEGKGILGGFMVVEKDGKPEIILDEGEIDIPEGARVEVLKKDGEIAIIVRKGEGGGGAEDLEKLMSSKAELKSIKGLGDIKDIDWTEEQEEETNIEEMSGDFELLDLRREFRQEKKKEEEEEETAEEDDEEPSFIDKLLKRVKKTTEESKDAKLKRMSLENLSRVKDVEDEKKALVGVAYVLKQFLEVKYEIPHELTYTELINEIRTREMNNDLRNRLVTFFKKTTLMTYAENPKLESPSKAYALAERAIKELS